MNCWERLVEAWNECANEAHGLMREKGFWETDRNEGEAIALMHSELSEALEGVRHGDPPSDKIPEFKQSEEEYADVLYRIMDLGAGMNRRIAEALVAKHAYNQGRAYKHGKQF